MDPDRLASLYKRQSIKLDFAKSLVPHFKRYGHEVGLSRPLRAVCVWLDEMGVSPSATAKPGTKWHPQRLADYLEMDGSDPSEEDALMVRNRKEGMRVTIRRLFDDCRPILSNTQPPFAGRWGSIEDWEEKLRKHELRTVKVAQDLRSALGK